MNVRTIGRIERVAVVGAGTMGAGIAQKVAVEGYPVVLVDVSKEQVARGLEKLRQSFDEGVERRVFTREGADEALSRIDPATDLAAARDADLVIEAVFEDFDTKRGVFAALDRACKPAAILATNTSSLYVRDLAGAVRRPDRFLGLHYFYHPAKNRLVEVVPGEATAAETLDAAWSFQEAIGKIAIRSGDAPGFIVNRFFVPWLNEAVRLLEEGVAGIPMIEAAARERFGVGMGPFELMNVTGVPIAFHAASTLGRELGAWYEPAAALGAQVERGVPWPLAAAETGGGDRAKTQAVGDRLLGATWLAAAQLVADRVGTIEDCDIGARVGLRWPLGPFELANREGVGRAARTVAELAGRFGLDVPAWFGTRARSGQPFVFELVHSEVRDQVATLTIRRPDALNAINERVFDQLESRFLAAAADPDVKGIVITGTGKAFVAGADLKFFIQKMVRGELEAIRRFTERAQNVLGAIAGAQKTVVARMNGLALGGGVELALACDYIVASTRAALGFPETGIGIYPGLGGTQRTRVRVGLPLTKYLILTGDVLPAASALEIGLVDAVVEPAPLDTTARQWALTKPAQAPRQAPALAARWQPLADLFGSSRVEALLEETKTAGGGSGGRGTQGGGEPGARARERAIDRMRAKAPLALRYAEEIIERGASLELDEAIRLELSRLDDVFGSEDALEGMRAVGARVPKFRGR